MNKPRVIKSVILPKLKFMLAEDITVLRGMLTSRTEESDVYGLLESLIDAKQLIIDKIPGEALSTEAGIPSTPDVMPIQRYRATNTSEIKDRVKLLNIIYQLESDQMNYVRHSLRSVGLTSGVKEILESILDIYLKITDQLDRSMKTNQIDPLVVK